MTRTDWREGWKELNIKKPLKNDQTVQYTIK